MSGQARTRLDHETNETRYAYARFIGESTEYVLNQVIDTVLARDKEFLQWRGAHPHSYVPNPMDTGRRRHRPPTRRPPTPAAAAADTVAGLSRQANAQ